MGSPPHTRGKVPTANWDRGVPGITPAHAGKSFRALPAYPGGPDHPRTRGEKTQSPEIMASVVDHPRTRGEKQYHYHNLAYLEGSPPHTRGKEYIQDGETLIERITPAHAGKR